MPANGYTESMVIDMKKNRIRIHKSTFHKLGDPPFIQLLFNPRDMIVAIRCTDEKVPDGQEFKVELMTDYSYELYSLSLMRKINKVTDAMQENRVYRLSGRIIPNKRIAEFPMNTMVVLE